VFRAIRELLINVARHAGLSEAHVSTQRVGDGLVATVSDAGSGFDPNEIGTGPQRGFGLTSVRERLAYIGGSVQLASRPGRGTDVTLDGPAAGAGAGGPGERRMISARFVGPPMALPRDTVRVIQSTDAPRHFHVTTRCLSVGLDAIPSGNNVRQFHDA